MKITYQKKIHWTKYNLSYPNLIDIIQGIRMGNITLHDNEFGAYTLKQAIEHIRSVNPSDMPKWKARLLPAVAYNGTFKELNNTGLIDYSSVTALDFDHIATSDDMVCLRNRLVITPCVLSVFVTPSGRGLKALVWHDNTDPNKHGDLYEQLLTSLRNRLVITPCVLSVFVTPSGRGLKALVWHDNTDPNKHGDLYEQLLTKFYVANRNDTNCKDLARRNYLSYDPYIWTNPKPVQFHYIPSIKPKVNSLSTHTGKGVSGQSIISIMNSVWKKNNPEYWEEGNRATSIFKLACLMCKWGVDQNLASEYFIDGWESDSMSEKEIQSHVDNGYKAEEMNFGTLNFIIR